MKSIIEQEATFENNSDMEVIKQLLHLQSNFRKQEKLEVATLWLYVTVITCLEIHQ